MADLTDTAIDAAIEHGKALRETEPRAASVRYDRQSDPVIVDLTNGSTFAFPPRLAPGSKRRHPTNFPKWRYSDPASGCIGKPLT
jgi:hypothetical protein